jgi:hypothetical protein
MGSVTDFLNLHDCSATIESRERGTIWRVGSHQPGWVKALLLRQCYYSSVRALMFGNLANRSKKAIWYLILGPFQCFILDGEVKSRSGWNSIARRGWRQQARGSTAVRNRSRMWGSSGEEMKWWRVRRDLKLLLGKSINPWALRLFALE